MNNFPAGDHGGGMLEKVLACAASAAAAVDSGRGTLDEALDRAPEDRRRILEHLLISMFRFRKSIRGSWMKLCRKPPLPEVAALLDAALTQCRFQSAVPEYSTVNVAVMLAKPFHADKFVNALLRRALREDFRIPAAPDEILPDGILKRWRKSFSAAEVAAFAGLFIEKPEFSFRLCGDTPLPENCLTVSGHPPFRFAVGNAPEMIGSPGFRRGDYYIQDPSASLAVSLAAGYLPDCRTVLDLCAAPGGKALMAAELLPPDAVLTASDPSAYRQKMTAANFALRNVPARIITAAPEDVTGEYDLVIADVPCSNTGVFRRRPDALWRFSEKSLSEIMLIQRRIVRRAAELTAPGGMLLLSTCSIETDENRALIEAASEADDFVPVKEAAVLPDRHRDGAFAALLRRKRGR